MEVGVFWSQTGHSHRQSSGVTVHRKHLQWFQTPHEVHLSPIKNATDESLQINRHSLRQIRVEVSNCPRAHVYTHNHQEHRSNNDFKLGLRTP